MDFASDCDFLLNAGAQGSGRFGGGSQLMIAAITGAVCEAFAFAEKLNLPSKRLLSVVATDIPSSEFLKHPGTNILESQFGVAIKACLSLKNLCVCQSLAQDLDIPVG